MNNQEIIRVANMIIEDCKTDVAEFDGREFNGKTLGEMHGILEAKISALANMIKSLAGDETPAESEE